MRKRVILLLIFIIFTACPCFAQLDFTSSDRVLILAPHPDDEIIATAGIIQKVIQANAELKIVYFTNGEYNEISYFFYKKNPAISRTGFINIGKTRQKEAHAATAYLKVDKKNLVFLGYPDRFTEAILTSFWMSKWRAMSMLTRIGHVPYRDALSYGAPYTGESILSDLKHVLIDFKPTKIFVSSPNDTNPDHRSLYVFTSIAILDLEKQLQDPVLYTYLIHKSGWPKVKRYLPSFDLNPPDDFVVKDVKWQKAYLTDKEIKDKREALLCYKSQLAFAKSYLMSFIRRNELLCSYKKIYLHEEGQKGCPNIKSKIISDITYNKDKEFLYINIKLKKNIGRLAKANVYLLAYRKDKDFSLMPKIFFRAKDNTMMVYEKRKRVLIEGAKTNSDKNHISIIFPLKALENPDHIFTRIILKGRVLALYAGPWRILEL